MRSWSACDSLGSTDTVAAASDSTNVTVDTQSSGGASTGSQAPSCRALAGSLASFDTSSLVNNEVELCVLWGLRGLQPQGFESCPRSECRLGFLTWGNGFLAGVL
ncbi:hypothetical protein E2C01_054300 [Portunus trituberculatus]|uniref:Uncharacterized protein n=1 Tax=Portunus trituberculatus TaxID=210409 RepID=A0A5B7GJI7_PORTR|nr:hypothetical protein [Portunus trituberculatus]